MLARLVGTRGTAAIRGEGTEVGVGPRGGELLRLHSCSRTPEGLEEEKAEGLGSASVRAESGREPGDGVGRGVQSGKSNRVAVPAGWT